jgi:hypothetical protein
MSEFTVPEIELIKKYARDAAYKPIILRVGDGSIAPVAAIFEARRETWVIDIVFGKTYELPILARQMNWSYSCLYGITDSEAMAKAWPGQWRFDILFFDNESSVPDNLEWERHRHLNGVALYKGYEQAKEILDTYIVNSNMKIRGQADNLVAFR